MNEDVEARKIVEQCGEAVGRGGGHLNMHCNDLSLQGGGGFSSDAASLDSCILG